MATAAAIRCENLDVERVRTLTVECESCDPDNPLAVPRKACRACGGSGRAPVGLAEIVKEIQASKKEQRRLLPVRGEDDADQDLYLEY